MQPNFKSLEMFWGKLIKWYHNVCLVWCHNTSITDLLQTAMEKRGVSGSSHPYTLDQIRVCKEWMIYGLPWITIFLQLMTWFINNYHSCLHHPLKSLTIRFICDQKSCSISVFWHQLIWQCLVIAQQVYGSRRCSCLVIWFCYQLIAKPGNKTAELSWPDPYFSTNAQKQGL